MTKYVVPVPDPAAGADWSTTVPGIYLWDVIGITATLNTVTPGPAPQQLFYTAHNGGTGSLLGAWIQPFSATENQFELRSESTLIGLSDPFPSIADNLPHMFAWVWDGAGEHYYLDGASVGVAQPVTPSPSPSALPLTTLGGGGPSSTTVDELSSFRTALSSSDVTALYAAGLAGFAAYSPAVMGFTPATYYHFDGPSPTVCTDVSGNGNDGTYFTGGGGTPLFVPGLIAGDGALQWAGPPPADETIVQPAPLNIDWTTPFTLILWSMQADAGTSTGRQPTLLVTNGTSDVLAIPTGFPAVSTPGPYQYAWQPNLNADTQSSDGTLTTVAIPQLILPAGYTVGTRTLDIQAADQWSNVSLWWDDDYQELTANATAYDYGNGAHLVYRQIGT